MDSTYGFPWLKWSRHFTQETTVRVELIEPYNLPSTVLLVDLWLGNDDYETTKKNVVMLFTNKLELRKINTYLLG